MQHHEFATLFPMLPDAELQSLADDISANGLQTPITTLDGLILDGRNRHRACEIAGVDPTFEEYLGGDPLAFVVSHNLHRRHLSESQRAMVAAKWAQLKIGVNQHNEGPPIGGPSPTATRNKAASLLNVGTSSVDRAKVIVKDGIPGLVDMVQSGEVSVAAATDVAKLTQDEQRQAVSGGVTGVMDAAKKSRLSKPSAVKSLDNGNLSPTPISSNPGKYIPEDGLAIWATAKSVMERILPQDIHREAALLAAKQYIETRIEKKK